MLKMKSHCERCRQVLPADQPGAVICSFECTFCAACDQQMDSVCPNCNGLLLPRPTRTGAALSKYPATEV